MFATVVLSARHEVHATPMIHPSTEIRYISEDIGHGLVATAFIPKGTITWALCDLDQKIAPETVDAMSEFMKRQVIKYAYIDGRGRHILCWDSARFVNHHCEANCLPIGLDFEVAIRDIEAGEQLTDDYGGLNIEEQFSCRCGSPKCRGVVSPTDILRFADEWDGAVMNALPHLSKVEQPLWPVVKHQREIQAILAGEPAVSCRKHYHPYNGVRPTSL